MSSGVVFDLVSLFPHKGELTKELLQYREKSTEEDERTAEFYSKQGKH